MVSVLVLMTAVGLLLGAWLGVQLMRQQGRILLRLGVLEQHLSSESRQREATAEGPTGLPIGTPAPPFALPDLQGTRVGLESFKGKRVLLIFFHPDCGFCVRMAGDLAALPVDGDGGRPVPVIITTGDATRNREWSVASGIRCPVLLQSGNEVASTYRAGGTPTGYLIDADGRVASGLTIGAEALLALAGAAGRPAPADGTRAVHPAMAGITRSLGESRIQRNGLGPGSPAPDFCLPDIDDGEVCLNQFRGQKVLLIFSDPHCGPCIELARRLGQNGGQLAGAEILLVSKGDPAENRRKAMDYDLPFPIVLQRQWEISRLYGRFGTPIGFLIDAAGLIEAEVAVGVEAIMALMTPAMA